VTIAPAPPAVTPSPVPAPNLVVVRRTRLLAVCVVLTGIAFSQQPGVIVPDSKLDLTANPLGLLERSLHLWDPAGFFGQMQNQAYGYLVPAGPFFVLGEMAGIPDWAVQRAWWSLLLCLAFLGVLRLAEALGVGTWGTAVVAGLVYALSPRVVSVIGGASVEVWPYALAPWVLVPLVVVANRGGSPRRAAALSGLALFAVGGVNAAATAMTLVLPALWLLTRQRGEARRRLTAWWCGAVALATLWWALPLVLLGRYSPPFLDWIEDAATTTAHTSPPETLAGFSHWLAHLSTTDGPVWPAGFAMVTSPVVVLNAMVLVALGLAGLGHARMPERPFLALALLTGLLLVGLGYTGHLAGLGADARQDLLDGVLAPLRNTHKYDAILRIPLTLGLAHALVHVRLPGLSAATGRRLLGIVTAAAMAATSGIALVVGLSPPGGYRAVPEYWRAAASWLDQQGVGGRALVVPGAGFAQFGWGTTRDEPLQALGGGAFGVRDAVPLSSAGNIRMLDAVERRLEAGDPSPGLAGYLSRMGVTHLVVRNDLDRAATNSPRPLQVRSALARTPGLTLQRSFGPLIGGAVESATRTVDGRLDFPLPAIDIWRVSGDPDPRVRRVPVTQTASVSGAPEVLLTLEDLAVDVPATVMAGDSTNAVAEGPTVVTDALRLREVDYGAMRDNTSSTLERGSPLVLDRLVRDYLVPGAEGRETAATLQGVAAVTASSSGGDVRSLRGRDPAHQPWSAIDGDMRTSWISGDLEPAVGQWWQVDLDGPSAVGEILVTMNDDAALGSAVRTLTVTTSAGSATVEVDPGQPQQPVPLPAGATDTIRLTVESVTDGAGGGVGIREVEIPGVTARRPLDVPWPGDADAAAIVLTTAAGFRGECITPVDRPLCGPQLGRAGEEQGSIDRRLHLPRAAMYVPALWVRPRDGAELERLLSFDDGRLVAEASSRSLAAAYGRPAAAVDRDVATGWVAAPGDSDPTITVSWGQRRPVSGVQLLADRFLPASFPSRVLVTVGGREYVREVDDRGVVEFPTTRRSSLTLTVLETRPLVSVDPLTAQEAVLPAGVSEIRVFGADDLRRPTPLEALTGVPCGFGPDIRVGDRVVTTSVRATIGSLLNGDVVKAEPCDVPELSLPPGPTEVDVSSSGEFDPVSLVLGPSPQLDLATSPADVTAQQWGPTRRTVDVEAASTDDWLVIKENYNPGWQATLDGRPLTTGRIDGWAQGVLVPRESQGTVELTFAPDGAYRAGLLLAPLGLVGLLGLLYSARRRPGPPVPAGTVGRRTAAVVIAAVLALLAGIAGLAALAAAWVMGRRHGERLLAGLAPLGIGIAGLVWATDVWPPPFRGAAGPTVAQVVVSLAAVSAAVFPLWRESDPVEVDQARGTSGEAHGTRAGTS
jgi:arabinofuranan 3-O-arabinosyltransferase